MPEEKSSSEVHMMLKILHE